MARDESNSFNRTFRSRLLKLAAIVFCACVMMPMKRVTALVSGRLVCRLARSLPCPNCRSELPNMPSLWTTIHQSPRFFSDMKLMMASVDEDEAVDSTKTLDGTWNVPGLKKEVTRLILRCHKKIAKVSTRLSSAKQLVGKLTSDDYSATLEELEECPDIDALEFELTELRSRLRSLNELERLLEGEKKKKAVLSPEAATLCLDLGVNDEPPVRPQRGPIKKKGPRQEAGRLPYRRFYTVNKTEIRVCCQNVECLLIGSVECVEWCLIVSHSVFLSLGWKASRRQ